MHKTIWWRFALFAVCGAVRLRAGTFNGRMQVRSVAIATSQDEHQESSIKDMPQWHDTDIAMPNTEEQAHRPSSSAGLPMPSGMLPPKPIVMMPSAAASSGKILLPAAQPGVASGFAGMPISRASVMMPGAAASPGNNLFPVPQPGAASGVAGMPMPMPSVMVPGATHPYVKVPPHAVPSAAHPPESYPPTAAQEFEAGERVKVFIDSLGRWLDGTVEEVIDEESEDDEDGIEVGTLVVSYGGNDTQYVSLDDRATSIRKHVFGDVFIDDSVESLVGYNFGNGLSIQRGEVGTVIGLVTDSTVPVHFRHRCRAKLHPSQLKKREAFRCARRVPPATVASYEAVGEAPLKAECVNVYNALLANDISSETAKWPNPLVAPEDLDKFLKAIEELDNPLYEHEKVKWYSTDGNPAVVEKTFTKAQTLMVVGDLHGRLGTLRQIHKSWMYMEKQPYVVGLGDMVDRGNRQVEVVAAFLAWRCMFPHKVMVLRGNHEIPKTNRKYGLACVDVEGPYKQLGTGWRYGLWARLNTIFLKIPTALVAFQPEEHSDYSGVFMHGGVGRKTLNKLKVPDGKPVGPELLHEMQWNEAVQDLNVKDKCNFDSLKGCLRGSRRGRSVEEFFPTFGARIVQLFGACALFTGHSHLNGQRSVLDPEENSSCTKVRHWVTLSANRFHHFCSEVQTRLQCGLCQGKVTFVDPERKNIKQIRVFDPPDVDFVPIGQPDVDYDDDRDNRGCFGFSFVDVLPPAVQRFLHLSVDTDDDNTTDDPPDEEEDYSDPGSRPFSLAKSVCSHDDEAKALDIGVGGGRYPMYASCRHMYYWQDRRLDRF